jgi:hypothetical protein
MRHRGRAGDIVTAANQRVTHEWWSGHRHRFDLYISGIVLDECNAGDPVAAQERRSFIAGISDLAVTQNAATLGRELRERLLLPPGAGLDALHIATAAVHGLDYLLTWNCAHIANASLRYKIIETCNSSGYVAPTICTPPELMDVWSYGQ